MNTEQSFPNGEQSSYNLGKRMVIILACATLIGGASAFFDLIPRARDALEYSVRIIHVEPESPPIRHEVQAKDTPQSISLQYYGNSQYASIICAHNYNLGILGKDCIPLQEGEIIYIPTCKDFSRLPPIQNPPDGHTTQCKKNKDTP